jgi:hypothetical protein
LQRAGKIISTAGWNNQHRKFELHQRGQMPMNGAIPTKNDDGVGVAR